MTEERANLDPARRRLMALVAEREVSLAAASRAIGRNHAYLQQFVKKSLKSPRSANFPFGGFQHVTHLGDGRYRVISYIDSQNSFGAQIRTNFEGVIRSVSGGWEMESLRFKT